MSADASELRAELLPLLCEMFRSSCGRAPSFPLRVTLDDAHGGHLERTFSLHEKAIFLSPGTTTEPRAAGTGPSTIPIEQPSFRLRRVHRKILEKATPEPVPTKRLIALAGYAVNAWSRDAVTELCRAGYLEQTPDGVRAGQRRPA